MLANSGLRRVLGACATAVLLTSCGGSQNQNGALVPNGAPTASERRGSAGMPAWAVGHELLYVARSRGVDVYSYPEGELEARLSNIRADGLCSDKNGDVYIPAGTEVLEYAHGGKRPIAVFRGTLGGRSQYCAVDRATGSLAVSGAGSSKSGVAVFAGAKAGAKTYTIAALNAGNQSSAYDDDGNLFVAVANGARSSARCSSFPRAATASNR